MVTRPTFTWGSDQPGAPAATAGGGAFYYRRKRFLAYITSCLVLVLLG